MDTSDRDLIARVLNGDRDSFHVIVRRHAGPLWSTVRASLQNLEDARDVFQETWLRAFQSLDTLRDVERLRSWLLSIALNLVRQNRRRMHAATEPTDLLDERPAEGCADPAAETSRNELVTRLRRRIGALPGRQREVLDLRVNHGLSHAEIGELLGIRADASRASYYQALRRLRASFDELSDELGGG